MKKLTTFDEFLNESVDEKSATKSLLNKKVLLSYDDEDNFRTFAKITKVEDYEGGEFELSFTYPNNKTIATQRISEKDLETLIKTKKITVKDDISPDKITITIQ